MVYEMLIKYNEVGLIRPLILIGIGYDDLHTMDSLRCRDYTYPQALADYKMATSGGAKIFLEFLKDELIPIIEKKYSVDTFKRILMGHSLGGYFTIFALLHDLSQNEVFLMVMWLPVHPAIIITITFWKLINRVTLYQTIRPTYL